MEEDLSHAEIHSISRLYSNDFAASLDNVLEVDWYSKYGLSTLLNDESTCRLLATLLRQYEHLQNNHSHHIDTETLDRTKALEGKVIWSLLCLVRGFPEYTSSSTQEHPFSDRETCYRLQIVEALLTNATLDLNPLDNLQYPNDLSPENSSKANFWYLIGRFVSTVNEQLQWTVLENARDLINSLETRDVIYSVMLCRFFADRIEGFTGNFVGVPTNPADQVNKALLAKLFLIKQEEGQGTSLPIQRICHMAVQSWNQR